MKNKQPPFWFIFGPKSRGRQFVWGKIVNCPLITCIILVVIPLKFVLYLSHKRLLCIDETIEMIMPGVIRWLKNIEGDSYGNDRKAYCGGRDKPFSDRKQEITKMKSKGELHG